MSFMDLFRPKWRSSWYPDRRSAVQKLTNQAKLARVAREDTHSAIRLLAVSRLTEQSLIATIAEADSDREVRGAAINRLSDQAILARVAERCRYGDVRVAAAAKLNDQLLAQTCYALVAQSDNDSEARETAVGRLEDQVVLARIARGNDIPRVRETAIFKIEDESVLAELARETRDYWSHYVREAAVKRLGDQQLLAEIAKGDTDLNVRAAAIGKLTDQSLLGEIAKNDKAWHAAISRLTDQRVLAEVACTSATEPALEALAKIETDQRKFTYILRNAGNASVRCHVIGRTLDQQVLAEAARCDNSDLVRLAAAMKLDDLQLAQTIYAEIARRSCPRERDNAIAQITDETILWDLITDIPNRDGQLAAIARLLRMGWKVRRMVEQGCGRCYGTGVVYHNIDSAFDRDVASYSCGCGDLRPYILTVSCEKDDRKITLQFNSHDLSTLREIGVPL
jgi:hypothetical protein